MVRSFRHIGGYFIGTVVSATAAFFSVPLLLRLLGESEFGRWSLAEPILLVGAQVALLGSNFGMIKLVGQDNLSARLVFRRLLKYGTLPMLVAALISAFSLNVIGFNIQDSIYLAGAVFFEAVLLLLLACLRSSHFSTAFAFTQALKALGLLAALSLALYELIHIDDAGKVILVRLATAAFASGFGAWLVVGRKEPESQLGKHAEISGLNVHTSAVRYGFPLLITALLTMILDYSSRYVLAMYLDLTMIAQYVVYTKLVSAVSLLVIAPFSLWWATERFLRMKDVDGAQTYFPLVATTFLLILLGAAGSLWLISAPVLVLFAPGVPNNPVITAMLLLSAVFMGMAYPLNVGLLKEGETHKNIYAVLVGAIAHLILCIVLIPYFSLIGAGLATMLGYLIYMVGFTVLSQKTYHVPFAYGEMLAKGAAALAALSIISYVIPGDSLVNNLSRVLLYWIFILALFLRLFKRLCEHTS